MNIKIIVTSNDKRIRQHEFVNIIANSQDDIEELLKFITAGINAYEDWIIDKE